MSETAREASISEIIVEFTQLFATARNNWTRHACEVHPELRGIGMMILQMIVRKAPITATELGTLLDMDKASMSRRIAKLRRLGLVEAEPSAEDRRVVLLTASAEATATLAELRRRSAESLRSRFEAWGDEDLAELQRLIHRFNASTDPVTGIGGARIETLAARD